jgi:hypothetical protein
VRRGRIVELRRDPRDRWRLDVDRDRNDRWRKRDLIGSLVKRNRIEPDDVSGVMMVRRFEFEFRVVVRISEMMRLEVLVMQRVPVVRIAFVHMRRRNRERRPHCEQRREDEQGDNATWRPRHSVIMSTRLRCVNQPRRCFLHIVGYEAAGLLSGWGDKR